MPVMWELCYQVRQAVAETGPQLPPETEAFGDDLEAMLSYLADSQPWLDNEHRLRNRAAFSQVSRLIAELLSAAQRHTIQQPIPPWLRLLLDHWGSNNATVITFNYDVLVEAASSVSQYFNRDSWSSLYRAPVVPAGQRLAGVFGITGPAPMALLKLHGSLTWYWSGLDAEPTDTIFDIGLNRGWSTDGLVSPYQDNLDTLVPDKVPMVVPPTATKSRFYDNAVLSSQWKQAARAIYQAQELVFIGYSLPKSDLITRSLLLTNFHTSTRVVPVDRSDRVLSNLQDLWGKWDIEVVEDFVGSDDAVEKWVQANCK